MSDKYWGPPGELMTEAEIHDFGIQIVVNQLQREGHEVVSIVTELNRSPQIVAKTDGQLAFITVRTAPYPNSGQAPSPAAKKKLLDFASEHNATAYFASVGITNAQGVDSGDERLSAKPIRGTRFYANYRGLRPLATLENVETPEKVPIGDAIPDDVNQEAFLKAVDNLAADLGLLDDLPPELANTVANVYYNYWERALVLGSMESRAPAPAGLRSDAEGFLDAYQQSLKTGPNIIVNYLFTGDFVRNIRELRSKHPEELEIYDYMVQLTLDNLKYDINNANKKSPIRRNLERRFKKPSERAGLYARMRSFVSLAIAAGVTGIRPHSD